MRSPSSPEQVLPAGFQGQFEQFGIGGYKVGGGDGVQILVGVESNLAAGLVIQPLHVLDGIPDGPGRDQVALLDEAEHGAFLHQAPKILPIGHLIVEKAQGVTMSRPASC